jgi:hypothetical protein
MARKKIEKNAICEVTIYGHKEIVTVLGRDHMKNDGMSTCSDYLGTLACDYIWGD